MAVVVNPALLIPENELSVAFLRSSGPGGQNVNKVASAVQLRFDLAGSRVLGAPVKARLRTLAGRRLSADGALLIVARSHRSQERNRRAHPPCAAGAQTAPRDTRPPRRARAPSAAQSTPAPHQGTARKAPLG
jgi:ribosome-associated protein